MPRATSFRPLFPRRLKFRPAPKRNFGSLHWCPMWSNWTSIRDIRPQTRRPHRFPPLLPALNGSASARGRSWPLRPEDLGKSSGASLGAVAGEDPFDPYASLPLGGAECAESVPTGHGPERRKLGRCSGRWRTGPAAGGWRTLERSERPKKAGRLIMIVPCRLKQEGV